MDNCQTFYLHAFVQGSLELLLWPNSKMQRDCITSYFDGILNSVLGGIYF